MLKNMKKLVVVLERCDASQGGSIALTATESTKVEEGITAQHVTSCNALMTDDVTITENSLIDKSNDGNDNENSVKTLADQPDEEKLVSSTGELFNVSDDLMLFDVLASLQGDDIGMFMSKDVDLLVPPDILPDWPDRSLLNMSFSSEKGSVHNFMPFDIQVDGLESVHTNPSMLLDGLFPDEYPATGLHNDVMLGGLRPSGGILDDEDMLITNVNDSLSTTNVVAVPAVGVDFNNSDFVIDEEDWKCEQTWNLVDQSCTEIQTCQSSSEFDMFNEEFNQRMKEEFLARRLRCSTRLQTVQRTRKKSQNSTEEEQNERVTRQSGRRRGSNRGASNKSEDCSQEETNGEITGSKVESKRQNKRRKISNEEKSEKESNESDEKVSDQDKKSQVRNSRDFFSNFLTSLKSKKAKFYFDSEEEETKAGMSLEKRKVGARNKSRRTSTSNSEVELEQKAAKSSLRSKKKIVYLDSVDDETRPSNTDNNNSGCDQDIGLDRELNPCKDSKLEINCTLNSLDVAEKEERSTNSSKKNTVRDRSGTKARETRNLFHKMGLNNFNLGDTLQFDSTENNAQLPESREDDRSEKLLEAGETNNLLENPSATIDCSMPSSKVDRLIDENVKACELDADSVVAEKKKRPKYKDISNNMEVEVDPQTLKLLFRSKTLKVSLNSIAIETDQQLQKCVGENSRNKRKSNTKVRKSQSLSNNVDMNIDSRALRPSASEADVCPQSTNEDVKVSEPEEGLNDDAEVQMSGGDSTEDAQVRKIGTSNKNLKRKKVEDDVDEELSSRKLRGSVDGTLMKMADNMDEEIQTRMSERRSDDGNRRKKFKRDSDELEETKEPEECSEKETKPEGDDKKVDRPKVKEGQTQIRKETDIDRKRSSKVSLENMDVVKKKSESQKKGKEPVEVRENVAKKSKKKLGIHERCRGPGCSSRIAVDSVYCSDDCIEGHVEESIKLLRKERLKEYSKSAMQSDCNRPLDRIVVFERKSGKLVTGPLAPTEATLLSWLQRHRTYEVLQPKSSNEPKSRPLSESRNRPLDVRKKISDNQEIYTPAAEKSRQSQKTKPVEKKELHKLIEKSGGQKPELAAKERTKTSSGLDSFRLCIRSDIRQSLLIRLNEDVLVSTAEVKQLAIDIENELHRYCKGMNSKYKDESQQLLELLKKSTSSKDDVAYQALCGTISPLKLIQLLSGRTSCDITNILSSSIFVDTTDRHGQHVFDVSCRICMGTSETTTVQPAPSLSIPEGNVASSALDRQLQSPIMVTSTTDVELVSSSNRDKPETSEANDLSSETSKVSSTFSSFRKLDDRIANLTSSRTVSMLDSFNALITQNFTSDAQSAVIKERSERSSSDTMIDVVWSGCLYAKELASINLCAFRTSGSMKILRSVLPRTINIMGRISPKVIEDYLMKIKTTFSTSKEVSVICFHCDNDEQRPNYKALFNYFNDRKRCGVVGTFGSAIKDMYIWPLPASAPLPSILLPFNGPGLDIYRTDLLLGIVVQKAQPQKNPGATSAGSRAPSSAPPDPRRMPNNAEPLPSANKLVSHPVDIPLTNESEEVMEESSDEDNLESAGEARKDPIVSKFSKREKTELLPAPVQVKKVVDDDAPYDPEVAAAEVPYDPELLCSYDPAGSANTSFSVPETDVSDDMGVPYDPEALYKDDDETSLKESKLSDSMVGTVVEQTADENEKTFETIGSSNGSKIDNDGVEELHPENASSALVPSEQFQIMHDSRSEVTSVRENVEKKTIQDLHVKQYLDNFSLILRQVSKSTNLEPCIMSGLLEGLTSMAGMSEYSDEQKILLKQLADVIKKQGSMKAGDCSRSDENSSDLAKTYAVPPKSMNEASLVPPTSVYNNRNLVNESPQECLNNRMAQVTGSSNNWAGIERQYTLKDNCASGIPHNVASYKTTNISSETESSRCSDINLKQILPVVDSILPQMSFESLRNILKSTVAPKSVRDAFTRDVTPCVASTGHVMGVSSSCLPPASMDVDYRQNSDPASRKTGSLCSHNSEVDNNLLSNSLNSVLTAPPRPPEILLKGGPTCFRAVLPPPPLPPSCLRLPRHEFPSQQSRPEFIDRFGSNAMKNPFASNTLPIPLASNRFPSGMVKNLSNTGAVPSSLGDPASHRRENFEKQIRERMAMTSTGFERLKTRPPLLPSPGLGLIRPGAPLFIPGPPRRLGLPYGPPMATESEINRTCSNVGDRLAAGRKEVADHTVKSTCGDRRFQEPGSFWNEREIREPPMQQHDTMSIDSIMPVLDYGHKSQLENVFKNETENFRDFNKEIGGSEDCPASEKRHGTHQHHNKDHHRGHSEDKRSHRDEKVRYHGDERERSRSSRSKSRSKSGKRGDVREDSLDQQEKKTRHSPNKSPYKSDWNRKKCDGSPRGRSDERREQNKYNSPRRRNDDRRKDSESPRDKNAARRGKNEYSSPRRISRERRKESESPRGRNFVQEEKDKHESHRSHDRRKEDDIPRNVDRHGKFDRDTRNGDSSRRKNEKNDEKNAGDKFGKKADEERPIGTRCDDVIVIDELEGGQSKAVEGESSPDGPFRSCEQIKNGKEEVVEHQENEDALVILEEGEIIADTDDPPCE